ncbi:hypothetical protein [Sphingobium cloacae]|nr:hypothetical protein [Sphingobium cloacae]
MQRLTLQACQPGGLGTRHALQRIGNRQQSEHGAVVVLARCSLTEFSW